MNNKIALESLAMDLKRVALGYHRGSNTMALRFVSEALNRKKEIDSSLVKPYIKRLLQTLEDELNHTDKKRVAENSLMISTLFQNYCTSYL